MYREVMGDILRVKDGAVAHCITSDYTLGAGLAKALDKKYSLKGTLNNIGSHIYPDCLVIEDSDLTIFNLVTKGTRYSTVDYNDLKECLVSMKEIIKDKGIKKVYVPKLGCGRDKLDWNIVKKMLKELFEKEKDIDLCVLFYIENKK